MAEDNTPPHVIDMATPEMVSAAFATGTVVSARTMVWLTFLQAPPTPPTNVQPITVVSRVVLGRDAARDLAEKLASALVDDS